MTSTIVPPVDLAPGMPSRVVTISATDVTEGGQSMAGQMVRFALSDTLDVSSGGDVIAKTQAEVVLDANGEGRIRLPVYDEDVKTWCGKEWAILVTTTWGSQKAIRVPAGTSSVALSALPSVRPLRGREKQWAITGASVTVTEGASWDIGVSLSGGVLDFDFTVPPGATAYYRGALSESDSLLTLESGMYWVGSTAVARALSLPEEIQGSVQITELQEGIGTATFITRAYSPRMYIAPIMTGVLGTWSNISPNPVVLRGGEDLDSLPAGPYAINSGTVAQSFGLPNRAGSLRVEGFGTGALTQTFTTNSVGSLTTEVWARSSHGDGTWPNPDFVKIYPIVSETRTAGVPLTFNRGSGVDTRPIVTVRIPVKFGADVKRIRAGFRNYDYRSGIPYSSEFHINGVAWGKHQMNPDGTMTGLIPEEPVVLSTGMDGGAGGITATTPWTEINAKAGEEYLLSYTVQDSGIEKTYALAQCFTNQIAGGWARVGSVTAIPQNFAPLAVHLEVEVDASTPVYAYLGDSMTAAQGASRPGYDSWANVHARNHGAIAQIYAEPGSSLPQWSDPMDPAWRRLSHLGKPDRLYTLLGYNDLGGTVTLATMQNRFREAMETAIGHTSANLYVATILPRSGPDPMREVRQMFNDWLKASLPMGATAALDFHDAIIDPATGNTDARWESSPGDAHPSTGGHARLALTTTMPDPTPPVAVTHAGDGVYEIG